MARVIYTCSFVSTRQGCRICGILGYRLPGTFFEKINIAWKGVKVKDTFFARNFYEKMKSAWKGAEVKDTFWLGTFGAEIKDTFWLGTFMKRKVFCISVPHEATCECIFHDN